MPPTPTLSRRLISLEQAAEYAGVSPRTVRRYVAAGRLTGYRVGPRLIRLDISEVDAMLRQPIPNGRAGDAA